MGLIVNFETRYKVYGLPFLFQGWDGPCNKFSTWFRHHFNKKNVINSIQTSFYTGGLIGLCLGFSFISGIEILFWLCCCCHEVKKKCLQDNIDESPENPAKASIYQIRTELVSSSVQTEPPPVQNEARNKKNWILKQTIVMGYSVVLKHLQRTYSLWPGRN